MGSGPSRLRHDDRAIALRNINETRRDKLYIRKVETYSSEYSELAFFLFEDGTLCVQGMCPWNYMSYDRGWWCIPGYFNIDWHLPNLVDFDVIDIIIEDHILRITTKGGLHRLNLNTGKDLFV